MALRNDKRERGSSQKDAVHTSDAPRQQRAEKAPARSTDLPASGVSDRSTDKRIREAYGGATDIIAQAGGHSRARVRHDGSGSTRNDAQKQVPKPTGTPQSPITVGLLVGSHNDSDSHSPNHSPPAGGKKPAPPSSQVHDAHHPGSGSKHDYVITNPKDQKQVSKPSGTAQTQIVVMTLPGPREGEHSKGPKHASPAGGGKASQPSSQVHDPHSGAQGDGHKGNLPRKATTPKPTGTITASAPTVNENTLPGHSGQQGGKSPGQTSRPSPKPQPPAPAQKPPAPSKPEQTAKPPAQTPSVAPVRPGNTVKPPKPTRPGK